MILGHKSKRKVEKVAIKSKGTIEHGKAIIECLCSESGIQTNFDGDMEGFYYFIDEDNDLCNSSRIPKGYTEIFV